MFLTKYRLKLVGLITFLVLLNLIWLSMDHESGRKPKSNNIITSLRPKRNWNDHERIRRELNRTGLGEVGSIAILEDYKKQLYKKYGYDAVLSDQISLNRSVPDTRNGDCQILTYKAQLPKAAIIIVFYNERLSVLLRTVHGIINRTPAELIEEIILVDDCSTYSELLEPLTIYLKNNLPTERSKVRLIRMHKRAGLMVARMNGARAASKDSEVLIFMDAHFEVNYNWLPPLLEPIALNSKTCTTPGLDHISFDAFEYKKSNPFRGYFDWKLRYKFFPIEAHELETPAKNYREYILMGAAVAISAEFFWELGGFDEGMELWGGEQFELSFKIWMCGGEIITVPCSRMAHLYRDFYTEGNTNLYGNYSFLNRNFRRLIDVWMDERHRQYVFNKLPGVKTVDPGDLTDRFAIRERLKCQNFTWMMDNIMSDLKRKYPPIEPNDLAHGVLRSVLKPNLCIALSKDFKVVMETCPDNETIDQNKYWIYTWRGELRTKDNKCLEANLWQSRVNYWSCHEIGGNQKWYYDRARQWITQVQHNVCMAVSEEGQFVSVANCNITNSALKWNITQLNHADMDRWERKLGWGSKD